MSILSNVTNWASDTKDKVTSTVKNATSSIGSWLNDTYNNSKTASIISHPSTSSSSSNSSSLTNAGYNSSTNTNNSTNTKYNSANNASKISNLYDTTKTITPQYSSLKAYEADTAKTTAIENIQKSLNTLGYTYVDEGELKIDGDFGTKTQSNWDNFISDLGVTNYLSGIGDKISSAYSDVKDWLGENGKDLSNAANLPIAMTTMNTILLGKAIDGGLGLAARNTDKTYTVGLQGDASAMINGTGSIGYTVDPNGNRGIVVTKGGGSGTDIFGYSGGLYGSVSNAKELQHLDSDGDLGVYGGVSANIPIAGIGAGYEYSGGMYNGDDEYDPYMINNNSLSISKGRSLSPVNIYGGVSTTDVYELDQDKNLLQNIYNILKNNNQN